MSRLERCDDGSGRVGDRAPDVDGEGDSASASNPANCLWRSVTSAATLSMDTATAADKCFKNRYAGKMIGRGSLDTNGPHAESQAGLHAPT